MEAVDRTLREMGAEEDRVLVVFNKVDAADPEVLDHLATRYPNAVFISAVTKQGLPRLREAVFDVMSGIHGFPGPAYPQEETATPLND